MMLFLKKKTEESEVLDAKPESLPLNDFIPYHCHYNPHTLLTKNGELLQIIKVASNTLGLNYESGDTVHATVRETIRRAIMASMKTDHFAIWVHTLRKRKNIRYHAKLEEPFSAYVHNQWQNKNRWKYQYYNEIYITILHEGQSSKLFDKKSVKRVLLPKRNRQYRNAFLEKSYKELDQTVSQILEKIRNNYNAQRLSIVERVPSSTASSVRQPIFYSEPMEFLSSLMNLRTEQFPLPELELGSAMCTHGLTFGFNALETKNIAGKRRFAAILSLKQYREVPAETADRVLQAPMEFIITQTFNFIPHTIALKQYKEQKEMFDVSGDFESTRASGIEEMMKSHRKQPTDFGEHQTSLMVLVDDYKMLDEEVTRVQAAFSELGLITIREDIKLEEVFWSQLPGNFEFIRRKDPINTERIGGFCRLNRFPNGTDTGNHWGDAITLIPTMVNSPYFFNFHHRDNGHTVLLDYNSFNDQMGQVMLNFLLSETRKHNNKLYYFDRNRSASLYFDRLGGRYHRFTIQPHTQPTLQLNPFTLDNTPRNQSFLLAWCSSILSPDMTVSDQQKELMRTAIAQLYDRPATERQLSTFVQQLGTLDPILANAFAAWHGNGHLSGLLDSAKENLDLTQPLHAFDMTPVTARPECIIPVFSYLMHRIILTLDGRPTVIVLNEAWDLLENAFFAPRLESLMEMLKQNNVMLILTTRKPSDHLSSPLMPAILQQCATHMIVPDEVEVNYLSHNIGLNENDIRLMGRMDRQKGDFLLKQHNESIALRANILELDDIYAIFANDVKNLVAAGGPFASLPQQMD